MEKQTVQTNWPKRRDAVQHHIDHHTDNSKYDHGKHDPLCRYCREMCVTCEREWQRMEA